MAKDPTRADVLGVYAGQRPLVHRGGTENSSKSISRSHEVVVSNSGLVSIMGGKWTTFRKMAEDTMEHAVEVGMLESRSCITESLHLHGWMDREDPKLPQDHVRRYYGSDAAAVDAIAAERPELAEQLHPNITYRGAEVVWAVRNEMALTVEDVLARRTRSLLLDARASMEVAPLVASIMAAELGKDENWQKEQVEHYRELASGYTLEESRA
jgi:glycerol-3-phosphate dehydrogenase